MIISYRKAFLAFGLLGALLTFEPLLAGQVLNNLISAPKNTLNQAAPVDRLNRTTPQSSIFNFLQACHDSNFHLASQYLDLRKIPLDQRSIQGPQLARQLAEILDRDPKFEVGHLNNTPDGDLGDGLQTGMDTLDGFRVNGQTISLRMQRENLQGVNVWLVSADSVARIPQLRAVAGESAIEKRLPQGLVTTKFIDTPLWVWLALVIVALILTIVSRLLSRIVIALLTPMAKRYAKSVQSHRLESFVEPLRLLLSVIVFRACMEVIPPSALVRDYLLKLLILLFIVGVAAFFMRVVDLIADRAISRLDPRQRALSYSVFPLFVRIFKIFIFCLAVLFVLSQWGYSTTTILAGVGVGGIAVALAAQKTIENLFGSVSLITDRPVLVGDFCQFGTQSGTVEDIGLRSTRIRTLDRTVVTIPNSVFSTLTLENFSRRDRVWFHPTLNLRRDTSPEQIRAMMEAVTKILQAHPRVDASGVPLRFSKITKESFDLDIFAYVLTADYNEYLKVQSELLLKFLDAAARFGVGFAVPVQESITAPTRATEPQSEALEAYDSDRKISK